MSTSILVHLAAAPRLLDLAGARRLVAPATLGDLAAMLAFLADHAGGAAFGSAEAEAALFSGRGPGVGLVVYLALRRHEPRLTVAAATREAATLDADGMGSLVAAFLRRAPAGRGDGGDDKRPIGEVDWCRLVRETQSLYPAWTYEDVMGLTLDQFTHARCGELGDGDMGGLSLDEVEAILAGEGGGTDG